MFATTPPEGLNLVEFDDTHDSVGALAQALWRALGIDKTWPSRFCCP